MATRETKLNEAVNKDHGAEEGRKSLPVIIIPGKLKGEKDLCSFESNQLKPLVFIMIPARLFSNTLLACSLTGIHCLRRWLTHGQSSTSDGSAHAVITQRTRDLILLFKHINAASTNYQSLAACEHHWLFLTQVSLLGGLEIGNSTLDDTCKAWGRGDCSNYARRSKVTPLPKAPQINLQKGCPLCL